MWFIERLLTKALDEVRKREQCEADDKITLFQYRKLFMTRDDRMTEKQQDCYMALSKTYTKTARAHRIVETLDTFYASKDIGTDYLISPSNLHLYFTTFSLPYFSAFGYTITSEREAGQHSNAKLRI